MGRIWDLGFGWEKQLHIDEYRKDE